jgi:hypothetical protein
MRKLMAEAGGCAGLLSSGRYDMTTFIFVLFLFPQAPHFLCGAVKCRQRVEKNLPRSFSIP